MQLLVYNIDLLQTTLHFVYKQKPLYCFFIFSDVLLLFILTMRFRSLSKTLCTVALSFLYRYSYLKCLLLDLATNKICFFLIRLKLQAIFAYFARKQIEYLSINVIILIIQHFGAFEWLWNGFRYWNLPGAGWDNSKQSWNYVNTDIDCRSFMFHSVPINVTADSTCSPKSMSLK